MSRTTDGEFKGLLVPWAYARGFVECRRCGEAAPSSVAPLVAVVVAGAVLMAALFVGLTARELSAAERWLRAGHWDHDYPLTRGTLRGKKLGIFGLGRIGKAIARRAEAMFKKTVSK